MLYAEHVAAEVLRQERIKAYALRATQNHKFDWLFHLIGLRAA